MQFPIPSCEHILDFLTICKENYSLFSNRIDTYLKWVCSVFAWWDVIPLNLPLPMYGVAALFQNDPPPRSPFLFLVFQPDILKFQGWHSLAAQCATPRNNMSKMRGAIYPLPPPSWVLPAPVRFQKPVFTRMLKVLLIYHQL